MTVTTVTAPKPLPRRQLESLHRPTLERVTQASKKLPNRVLFHALPKWGKTSFAAYAPAPIFTLIRGEDGLETLIDNGQLPETPHFQDQATTWTDLLAAVEELITLDHAHKTFVLDTINGAERLCHEHVCRTQCDDDWAKFDAYGRGPKIALAEFSILLQRLDRLREAKGMSILLLCHSQVKTFKNPEGNDYDRWEPVLAKETAAIVDRWSDMILFGTFETIAETKDRGSPNPKAKAKGGQHRLIMTERHAAYDAGNRHGLPSQIDGGDSPQEAWTNFLEALKGKTQDK